MISHCVHRVGLQVFTKLIKVIASKILSTKTDDQLESLFSVYPSLCYKKVCYKGTVLYIGINFYQHHIHPIRNSEIESRLGCT